MHFVLGWCFGFQLVGDDAGDLGAVLGLLVDGDDFGPAERSGLWHVEVARGFAPSAPGSSRGIRWESGVR